MNPTMQRILTFFADLEEGESGPFWTSVGRGEGYWGTREVWDRVDPKHERSRENVLGQLHALVERGALESRCFQRRADGLCFMWEWRRSPDFERFLDEMEATP